MADNNSGSSSGESSDSPTTSFLKCRETFLSSSDDDDSTISSVTQEQNIKTRFQEPGFNLSRSESWMNFPVLSDETVGAMVEKESEHLPKYDYLYRLHSGDLDLTARNDALDWNLEVCPTLILVFLKWDSLVLRCFICIELCLLPIKPFFIVKCLHL